MTELTQPQIDQLYLDWTELGAKQERERIINLLESIDDYPPNWDYNDEIGSVIALIKGEQK